jgi:hypothetical protein
MRAPSIVLCGAALLVSAAPAQAAGERCTVWRVVKARA